MAADHPTLGRLPIARANSSDLAAAAKAAAAAAAAAGGAAQV
jgi:hypothetical protein